MLHSCGVGRESGWKLQTGEESRTGEGDTGEDVDMLMRPALDILLEMYVVMPLSCVKCVKCM